MKPYRFEEIFPNDRQEKRHDTELSEQEAEQLLESLLKDPENAFLTKVKQNSDVIENADSFNEALQFAERRIRERLTATLNAKEVRDGHSEQIQVNPDTVLNALDHIKRHSEEIGIGADGRVVIDTTDVTNINPEICYKFALLEKVKRGRNSVAEEAELQSAFYEAASKHDNKDIGVPMPYYEIEVFTTQMIAMEKLRARSVDELLRSIGTLPPWFDVDRFCNSLKGFIDAMHKENLYHRDLHFGNIMISQRREWQEGEPMGYVIDFGLSGYALENMEPYKKDVADMVFTYDNDYGRIELLRKSLKALQSRQLQEK
jgi:tRNA A-37 threonylcarbamoyl transferase component Bud32